MLLHWPVVIDHPFMEQSTPGQSGVSYLYDGGEEGLVWKGRSLLVWYAAVSKRCDTQHLITPSAVLPASTHHEYILPCWVQTLLPGWDCTITWQHLEKYHLSKQCQRMALAAVVVKIVRFPRKRAIPAIAMGGDRMCSGHQFTIVVLWVIPTGYCAHFVKGTFCFVFHWSITIVCAKCMARSIKNVCCIFQCNKFHFLESHPV